MSISQNYPIVSPSLNLDFANTKVLDSRITFSRPTSAVYYDGQTVSLAEQNLVLQSQTFDNASWNKASSTTVTSNASNAPDGTLTASALLETATTGTHFVYQTAPTPTATVQNFSAYIKANGRDFATVGVSTSGTSNYYSVTINLTSGVITQELKTGAVGASGSAIVISVGGGWYRVSTTTIGAIYVIVGSASQGTFTSTNSGFENYLGDITKGIYAWGAQLEQRDTVTAYQQTTTQPITNYIPTLLTATANTARFDHNPVTGESLGLLVEEQRTNLTLYSEQFDNAAWGVKSNSSITANTIISPDGTLSADKLVENTASGQHWVGGNTGATITSGVAYTLSVYAKQAERGYFQMYGDAGGGRLTVGAVFNLTNGTVYSTASGAIASITSVDNGWYRCSVTATASSTGSSYLYIGLRQNSAPATDSYTGDGYSGIYLWGAQLEAGSFPTSYLKTEASQVTRSADSANMTGANFSDWYRQDEGTVYVESKSNGLLSVGPISAEISNGTIYELLVTGQFISGAVRSLIVTSAGVNYVLLQTAVNPIGYIKSSGAYKFNDFSGTVNGGTVSTDANGILPNVNQLNIGSNGRNTAQMLNGHVRKLSYYPQALTQTQLQAITS